MLGDAPPGLAWGLPQLGSWVHKQGSAALAAAAPGCPQQGPTGSTLACNWCGEKWPRPRPSPPRPRSGRCPQPSSCARSTNSNRDRRRERPATRRAGGAQRGAARRVDAWDGRLQGRAPTQGERCDRADPDHLHDRPDRNRACRRSVRGRRRRRRATKPIRAQEVLARVVEAMVQALKLTLREAELLC